MAFVRDKTLRPPELDVKTALGYTVERDAADGRPAHLWCRDHDMLNDYSVEFATAGMITHGCIANLDNYETEIPNHAKFKDAVSLGNKVSPYFASTRPLRWAAIHYSKYARDKYLPDESLAWRKVLYPMCGAYKSLLRAHLPAGIITDSQLEQGLLHGYKILFLPAPQHLTVNMKKAVEAFKQAGGKVIEQQNYW